MDLRESIKVANLEPGLGVARLTASLEAIDSHPELLAHDPPTQELRRSAALALARAELAQGNSESAAAAIDRVLIDLDLAGELDAFDASQVGPSVRPLVDERRQHLAQAPRSRLRITCGEAVNEVLVEGREVEVQRITGPGMLLPARGYTVVTSTASGSSTRDVVLATDSPVTTLECEAAPLPAPPPADDMLEPSAPRRVAPRWVEGTLVGVGLATSGAGAALIGIDGTCQNGGSTTICPSVFETDRAGAATLAVGAAVLVAGVALLAVDSARKRKHERARVELGLGIVRF